MLSNMASNMAADCASRCLSCAMGCQMVPACAEGAQSLCTQLTDKQLIPIFPHLTFPLCFTSAQKSNAGAILGHCLQHPQQCPQNPAPSPDQADICSQRQSCPPNRARHTGPCMDLQGLRRGMMGTAAKDTRMPTTTSCQYPQTADSDKLHPPPGRQRSVRGQWHVSAHKPHTRTCAVAEAHPPPGHKALSAAKGASAPIPYP